MAAVPELRPFTALRPLPQLAHRVAAPPYDVVDAEQAREAMLAAPDSFLRVTRPDADPWLDAAPAPGDEHEHGRHALSELVRRGVLVREQAPALWVYRQQVPRSAQGARAQTGIVGLQHSELLEVAGHEAAQSARPLANLARTGRAAGIAIETQLREEEVLHPQRPGAPVGQRIVESGSMRAQVGIPHAAGDPVDRRAGVREPAGQFLPADQEGTDGMAN